MGAATTDEFAGFRLTVYVAGSLLVLLAVSGVLVSAVFTQASTIKYVVTVIAAASIALLATVRAPLRLLVGIAIVAAPLDFVTTFAGLQVTPLLAVDVLAVLVWLSRPSVSGRSAVRTMTPAFVVLLAPAIVGAAQPGRWVLWLAVTVATGCLTFVIAREPGGPAFVAVMLTLSALVQGAIAIWEFRTGHRLNLYQASGFEPVGAQYFFLYGRELRPAGALADPIGLGQVLALCIPMMVALAASARRLLVSLAVLGAVGLAAVALLLSLSRMSMVGGAIGVAVVLALLPARALLRRGAPVAAALVIVALVALSLGGRPLTRRIDSIFHPTAVHVYTAPSDLTRLRIWRAALKTAEANLVTGVGFGNITTHLPRYGVPVLPSSHAHDTYLQFFAEGGVLGLVALLGLVGSGAVDLLRAFGRHRIWVAGAAGSLVATLVAWITDVEVRYTQVSAMVAVLLGLIAALALREDSAPVERDQPDVDDPPVSPTHGAPIPLAGVVGQEVGALALYELQWSCGSQRGTRSVWAHDKLEAQRLLLDHPRCFGLPEGHLPVCHPTRLTVREARLREIETLERLLRV